MQLLSHSGLQRCAVCDMDGCGFELPQCLWTHDLQVGGSKRLSCRANLCTVSRCCTRGESEDYIGKKARKGSTLALKTLFSSIQNILSVFSENNHPWLRLISDISYSCGKKQNKNLFIAIYFLGKTTCEMYSLNKPVLRVHVMRHYNEL